MVRGLWVAWLVVCGCGNDAAPAIDAPIPIDGIPAVDAPIDAAMPDGLVGPGIAPPGAIPDEVPAQATNVVALDGSGELVLRVDAAAGQHVAFALTLSPDHDGVTLAISAWDGMQVVALGETDPRAGYRALAALDATEPRTFWATVRTATPASGMLQIERTPFVDAAVCVDDCARLLQVPLPLDRMRDGYDLRGAIHRYQFGRRDLVMLLRAAARRMADAGEAPVEPRDLSQWDGAIPGSDVGAPRHVSHQRGKDLDVSLYGTDGAASWRNFCETQPGENGNGFVCTPGTVTGFDGERSARLLGTFFASDAVIVAFLDDALIAEVQAGAQAAVTAGTLDPALLPLYSDGVHLRHAANQYHHVHVRVREVP